MTQEQWTGEMAAAPGEVLAAARRVFADYARDPGNHEASVRLEGDAVAIATDPEKVAWGENTLGIASTRASVTATAREGGGSTVVIEVGDDWVRNPHDNTVALTGIPGGLGGLPALAASPRESLQSLLGVVRADLTAELGPRARVPQPPSSGIATPGD